jgi:hypothetical protein
MLFYSDDQPRDERGRWGGGAELSSGEKATLIQHAHAGNAEAAHALDRARKGFHGQARAVHAKLGELVKNPTAAPASDSHEAVAIEKIKASFSKHAKIMEEQERLEENEFVAHRRFVTTDPRFIEARQSASEHSKKMYGAEVEHLDELDRINSEAKTRGINLQPHIDNIKKEQLSAKLVSAKEKLDKAASAHEAALNQHKSAKESLKDPKEHTFAPVTESFKGRTWQTTPTVTHNDATGESSYRGPYNPAVNADLKEAGARWDPNEKKWNLKTNDPNHMAGIISKHYNSSHAQYINNIDKEQLSAKLVSAKKELDDKEARHEAALNQHKSALEDARAHVSLNTTHTFAPVTESFKGRTWETTPTVTHNDATGESSYRGPYNPAVNADLKEAGARWDPNEKKWNLKTNDPNHVAEIISKHYKK